MQVQSISNQSFGQVRLNPATSKYIDGKISNVEKQDLLKKFVAHKKNPMVVDFWHSEKNGEMMAAIGYPYNPTVRIFMSESSYGKPISPHDFMYKVCKKADYINERKLDLEDFRLMASKVEK